MAGLEVRIVAAGEEVDTVLAVAHRTVAVAVHHIALVVAVPRTGLVAVHHIDLEVGHHTVLEEAAADPTAAAAVVEGHRTVLEEVVHHTG